MLTTLRSRLRGDDSGQVLLLSIAFTALALALVLVVVSATSVHLERKRLLALADTAALAAASELDTDAYYARGTDTGDRLVVLTAGSVRRAAQEHLSVAPVSARLHEVTLVDTSTPDGRTAVVTLRALARPPLLTWATSSWSDGITLQVTSSARAS